MKFIKRSKMDDTHPHIAKKYHELMLQKSGGERLQMGCSLFDTAKTLVLSSIRARNPNITPSEERKEIFLRFYRNDFTLERLEKIIHWLNQS